MRKFWFPAVLFSALFLSSCALVPGGEVFLSEADKKTSEENPSITLEQIEFHKITSTNTKRKLKRSGAPHRNTKLEQQVSSYVYKVGAGDVLRVIVWEHPELLNLGTKESVIPVSGFDVDNKGFIFYPYVGRFHVAGQSIFAIQASLSTALAKYIENPQLSVKVTKYLSKKIYLTGQVNKPIPQILNNQAVTLFDALTA
ncbi:MAG: polysaccharide biosynthesis/export family protein, partial [Hyphomicrobiales bacterium]